MTQLVVFFEGEPIKQGPPMGIEQLPVLRSLDYQFPQGPVACNLVYVPHPHKPKMLVPFGQYDDFIVEEKFNEALRIVTELGACEVKSQSFIGDSIEGAAEASFKGIGWGGKAAKNAHRAVNYHQVGTGGAAVDPAPLQWPHEPGFDAARVAVLRNGAREIEIRVTSDQAFSIDSDVAAALKKVGFTLGVSIQRAGARSYLLYARFPGPTPEVWPSEAAPTPMSEPSGPTFEEPIAEQKKRSWFS